MPWHMRNACLFACLHTCLYACLRTVSILRLVDSGHDLLLALQRIIGRCRVIVMARGNDAIFGNVVVISSGAIFSIIIR